MSKTKPIEEMSYEEAFSELETIITQLEDGEQTLAGALEVFTRGQLLIKHCAEMLEIAELKVRELSDELTEPEGEE